MVMTSKTKTKTKAAPKPKRASKVSIVAPKPSPKDAVAELLDKANKAHKDAMMYRSGKERPQTFRESWQEAYDARKQAHVLDPAHSSPAWAAEQGLTPRSRDTHGLLMSFYEARGCK